MKIVIPFFLFGYLAAAEPPISFSIGASYSENHVTINGYLDEWGDLSGFRSIVFKDTDSTRRPGLNDDFSFAVQWDSAYLYLACFIHDQHLNAITRSDLENTRQDDAIELFIDTKNDSGPYMSDDDYQLVIGLNNNANEYRGSSELRKQSHTTVPRIQSRDLQYRSFVRWYGTLNDNRDRDSGFAVEIAVNWKSLKMDPAKQHAIRFDIGNIDLDTNDFRDPETWRSVYYSEFLYGDRSFAKSPNAWVVLNLNPLPLKGTPAEGQGRGVPAWAWILAFAGAVALALFLALYYRRINAINEEMKNQVLVRLKQYLQEHFREKITLDDFCKVHNYPEKRVQRIFKENYGATFANVILQKRMEEARRLLETTDKNVTEVCFEVGFNDASYFTKSFKAFFNMLPKDVKKTRA